ncbi:hypothetical protein J6590_010203 [Homalodisca vitripennis]|nr:hypothetical protein J6590_010203 [Homalodisca vitripennis]
MSSQDADATVSHGVSRHQREGKSPIPCISSIRYSVIENFEVNIGLTGLMGVPISEWSKTLNLKCEFEIARVQILFVTIALFISNIDLVLYRLSPLFCLIRSSHRPVAHEDGQNKAQKRIDFSFKKLFEKFKERVCERERPIEGRRGKPPPSWKILEFTHQASHDIQVISRVHPLSTEVLVLADVVSLSLQSRREWRICRIGSNSASDRFANSSRRDISLRHPRLTVSTSKTADIRFRKLKIQSHILIAPFLHLTFARLDDPDKTRSDPVPEHVRNSAVMVSD